MIALALGCAVAAAQTTPSAAMPSEPSALLSLAAKSNGLEADAMKPWRMKIAFQLFDDQGNATQQGTIEEAWAGAHRSKTVYTVGGTAQIDYRTEKGVMRSETAKLPPGPFLQIDNEFVQPIANEQMRAHWVLAMETRDTDKAKFLCAVVKAISTPDGNRGVPGPIYCFEPAQPVLRILANPANGYQVLFNDIRVFEGHSIAGEILEVRNGKKVFSAHLESLVPMEGIDEAELTPPLDAVPVPKTIAISAGVAQGLLLRSGPPTYPAGAKAAGIEGTVVLQATIGTDGKISELRAMDGPQQLRQAAAEAVKQWVYKPYVLNGEIVSVQTTIHVTFRLGSRNPLGLFP